MRLEHAFIPYGGYWCTPFVKWQGNFAPLHPIRFAAEVCRRSLTGRGISATAFDGLHLGMTVPAQGSFYGAPWLAGLIGVEAITGPTINQACATSARVLAGAAAEVEAGNGTGRSILCITADRTSNGPHVFYPNPLGPGGKGESEDWVWDNFQSDPFAGISMIETAENVARDEEITTLEQNELVLLRYEQYQAALANDAAFHRRYMVTPVEVNPSGKKPLASVIDDEGIYPTTAEGLLKLKPVLPGGTVTYGGQTYPADGNAGMIVTTREGAREFNRGSSIEVRVVAFAEGRAEKGFMPKANVPATRRALEQAGIAIGEVKTIKTHNPFALNDIYFARELGVKVSDMNNFGSSLIWGHPQGPTGMRLIIEMIEELVLLGGGYGLFTGCAAGDSAAAVVVKVSDASE